MDHEQRERHEAAFMERMTADFVAPGSPNTQATPEVRQAWALEYIAYQLGWIRSLMVEDRTKK